MFMLRSKLKKHQFLLVFDVCFGSSFSFTLFLSFKCSSWKLSLHLFQDNIKQSGCRDGSTELLQTARLLMLISSANTYNNTIKYTIGNKHELTN